MEVGPARTETIRTRGYGWDNDSICYIVFKDFLCARHSHIIVIKMDFVCLHRVYSLVEETNKQCPKDRIFCDGRKDKCVWEGLLEKLTSKLELH